MWPAKSGLGAQLTYGVLGNPVMEHGSPSDPNSASSLEFPRRKNGASSLYPIQNSCLRLSQGDQNSIDDDQLRAPKLPLTVGHELMKAMAAEADPFQKDMGRDPCASSLSVVFDLGIGEYGKGSRVAGQKHGVMAVRCVACVEGADSILVCPLLPRMKNVIHLSDPCNSKKTLCAVPNLDYMAKCTFPFRIQQILYSGGLLAVRGADEISFLEVTWNNDPNIKGLYLSKAFSKVFSNVPILHSEMKSDRLAVFDSEKNCTFYSLCKDPEWSIEKISCKQLPARNPFDPSDFLRACWSSVSDTMIIMHRKTVMGVSLESDEVRKYVNFHNWSHLLDFQQSGPELFMLTSQEIIWFHLNKDNDLQRLLSWKHYLDFTDYSLRMTLHLREKDNVIVCLVYSCKSPIIIHYSFSMRGNKPYSVKDPYYIRSSLSGISHISVCSSAFGEDDYLMNYFQIGANHEVNYLALSFQPDLSFKQRSENNVANTTKPTPSRFIPLLFSRVEERFLLEQFRHSRSNEPTDNHTNAEKGPTDTHENSEKEPTDTHENSEKELTDTHENSEKEPRDKHTKAKKSSNGRLLLESHISASNSDSSDVDAVQTFAFELGADIDVLFKPSLASREVPSFKSLATIAKNIPTTISDLAEFGSMLEQLSAFYERHNIKLDIGDWRVVNQLIPSTVTTSQNLSEIVYEAFNCYKSDPKVMKAVIILASTLIKAHNVLLFEDYDSAIAAEAAQHEPPLQDIFEEWKLDDSLELKARHGPSEHTQNRLSERAPFGSSQGVQPSPIIADSQSTQDSRLPDSQPSASLEDTQDLQLSPPVPAPKPQHSSQVPSQPQSQPRSQSKRLGSQNSSQRRKKKKGGFA